jgi:hypothetical protein
VLFALLYMLLRHARAVAGVTIVGLMLSHWILDVITHRPDLPVTLHGTARLGLGLWNSLPATLAVETLLFAIGVFFYSRTTRAIDRIGSIGLWALVGFLLVTYAGTLLAPAPPSVSAVAWGAESMWLLVAWGCWIDRHRAAQSSSPH